MRAQWWVLIFAVISLNAQAQTMAPILEIGIDFCSDWSKERQAQSFLRAQLESWALGFLSGWSWTRTEPGTPFKSIDEKAVFAWIDRYCRANPADGLPTALSKFVVEMESRAATTL
jgi:hypothetical protein